MKFVHREGLTKEEIDDMIINEVAKIIFENASYSYDVTYSQRAGEVDAIHVSIDLYKIENRD